MFLYLLIFACVIFDLIHQILKPYHDRWLNVFDGIILHLLVLVSVLPLAELFDSFNYNFVAGNAFVLVILPSVGFIAMKIIINRRRIKRYVGYCYLKCFNFCSHSKDLKYDDAVPLDDTEALSNNYGIVVDDSKRINATVCTM